MYSDTHTPSHHQHHHHRHHHALLYIRTLYRATLVNLQHYTTHWLLARRERGDAQAWIELLLLQLRSRKQWHKCGASSRQEAVTAGGRDTSPLTSCRYDDQKVQSWSKPSVLARGQYSLSTFHVPAIVISTAEMHYARGIEITVSILFMSKFSVNHFDVRINYGDLYDLVSHLTN
jgi:hypothetical protein